jgi:lipopolysaccharide/colanic/teichoic acid biosynthesis glycosyltransferase
MVHQKVAVVLRGLFSSKKAKAADLLPAEHMHKVLARERARAERTGEVLSVLTLQPAGAQAATVAHLAEAFATRLRITDVPGWLDRRRLCVVLPGTAAEGAWRLADELYLRLPEGLPAPHCAVYSFPTADGGDDGDAADGSALPGTTAARPVHSLETLFLLPVPVWKRTLDVLIALTALVVLGPLLGLIALAVKMTSRGPVFFSQWRSGRGGRPFRIYKFRTMVVDAEVKKRELMALNERDGPAFKITNDPRITRLGRFLRKTSLDELPQLWNVIKGDMCLVGPRPLPLSETARCAPWHRRRLDVQPGLTCIWQVRGRGGVSFAEWIRMDVEYIRGQSFWQDMKLLFLTVPVVLLRRGAH